MAVNVWGIVSLVFFYLVIFAIGIWASWKSKSLSSKTSSDDLMVARRSIGKVVGIFTMTATWVGGGYINGTAEYVFAPGFGLIWTQAALGYSLSLILSGIFFAEKMRTAGYVTMLDPFYQKYGSIATALLYIPAFCGDLFWSAAILSALGSSLTVVLELNITVSIVVSASIAVVYTLFGGLYSVAYTDVIQLIFIWVGLYLCVPFAMTHDAVTSIADTAFNLLSPNSTGKWIGEENLDSNSSGLYIDGFLLLIFGGIPWQVYFQRVLSAKTVQSAKLLSYLAGLGCIFSAIPAVLIGAIAASTDWNKTELGTPEIPADRYRDVLPIVLQYLCPAPVAFIGLGAVSAAVMSSTDSSILSASSMFSRNIYKPFRTLACGQPSERELIWVMRVFTVVIGAVATIMAINVNSTYALWFLCSDLVYVLLFPQLICVLYVPFSNVYGALVAFFLGIILRVGGGEVLIDLDYFIKYPWFDEVENVQRFPFKTLIMIIVLITIITISRITEILFQRKILSPKLDVLKAYNNQQDNSVVSSSEDINQADYGTTNSAYITNKDTDMDTKL